MLLTTARSVESEASVSGCGYLLLELSERVSESSLLGMLEPKELMQNVKENRNKINRFSSSYYEWY